MFYIREYRLGDEEEIVRLFQETVRNINIRDYSEEQIKIWAPDDIDLNEWKVSLAKNFTFVAVKNDNEQIIGFADLTDEGCLNRGYVHKDYQGYGIGTSLLTTRESKARDLKIKELFAQVSITAKPFFEKQGYKVQEMQTKNISGVAFTVFLMKKNIL